MTVTANIRPLSVGDYHQMVAAGILAPDERVELIEGQLFQMAAKGTLDSAAMTRIKRSLEAQLANRALVRYQDPIQLNETSEPEPDVAVVRADPWDYERHHPMPEDVFWIIEVADRSLTRDRDLKAPVYRRSGSREYWILDVRDRRLFVFWHPSDTGYREERVLSESERIAPLAFEDCEMAIADWLNPSI
jgi:Uma2 family endonuclease